MDWWGYLDDDFRMLHHAGEEAYNWLTDLVPDDWKAHPGDPGYWNPSETDPEVDILPYVPGIAELQEMANAQAYWKDYKKNTGFSPRYPGMAVHTPTVSQTAHSFDWWLP